MIKFHLLGHLTLAVFSAVFNSGFQHGYNTGVVNNAELVLETFINEVEEAREPVGKGFTQFQLTMLWSAVVSIYCVGGMFGGVAVAPMADRWGRKGGLLLNNIFVLVGAIFLGSSKPAKSYEMLLIGRFIMGINSGLNAGLATLYVSEIAPVNLRGALASTYQLVITVSILISQVFSMPACMGTASLWPLLLALVAIPAILQTGLLLLSPESPKYLLLKNKSEQANKALRWLRETEDINDELLRLETEIEATKRVREATYKDMIMNKTFRVPLIIAICVMLAQQLSGINAVMYFSTNIFISANLTEHQAVMATLIMGGINVAVTVVSLFLVERLGRRPLLLAGLAGCAISCILLTVCLALKDQAPALQYVAVLLVYVFVVLFAVGLGPIPWFLVTELFDQQARAKATGIAIVTNWSANFLVGMIFLPLKNVINEYVFLVFAGISLFFLAFVAFRVPETKGRSIGEILGTLNTGLPSSVSKQELNTGVSVDTLPTNTEQSRF